MGEGSLGRQQKRWRQREWLKKTTVFTQVMDKHMESNALHQCREWGEFSWGRRGWGDKGYKSAAVNMIDYPWSAEEGFLDSKRTSIRTVCRVDFRVLVVYRCEHWKHKVRRCSGKPGHKHVCRRGGPVVTGPRRTESHGEMPTRELNLTEQKPEKSRLGSGGGKHGL